jgi:predicted O-linked N-acetylglucosamine transferase (SPINDLY family)
VGNRLTVFAKKPAPVQVTARGCITGTGLEAMDAMFADPVVIPEQEKFLYTEEVVYLPSVISALFPVDPPPVNALPAQSTGSVTFGSTD